MSRRGFTLAELLVVVAIIGILSSVTISILSETRDRALLSQALSEIKSIYNAIMIYRTEYREFPADVTRDLPSGLEEFLGPGFWPKGPWPGSVYDWDNWDDPDEPGRQIIQISVRFCPAGDPAACRFPPDPWAENFDYHSAVYYCIEGNCRSHVSQPADHPGLCLNCAD